MFARKRKQESNRFKRDPKEKQRWEQMLFFASLGPFDNHFFLLRNANYVIENVLLLNVLITAAHNNGAAFKSLTTTTSAPKSGSSKKPTSRGKRKIIVNLMDVYHCPKPGEHTDWTLKPERYNLIFPGGLQTYILRGLQSYIFRGLPN